MAKDIYHNLVREALELEKWSITDDPLYLYFGKRKVATDLGAEKWIVAEKGKQKIAVEVKSFITLSVVNEMHHSVGQLDFYRFILDKQEPDRILYLAMPQDAYDELMEEPLIEEFFKLHNVKFIIFDTQKPIIRQWIN